VATVYRDKKSPYWFARFHVWDAGRGKWKLAGKSTRETDQSKALVIAAHLELAARASGPEMAKAGGGLDRARAARLIDSIVALSDTPSVARVSEPTVEAFAERWLAEKRDPKTRANYAAVLEKLLEWGRTPGGERVGTFRDVSPQGAERWRDWLDARVGLSRNRVNFSLTVVGGLWIKAMRLGLVSVNPFASVARLALDDVDDNRAARPFDAVEIARLIEAAGRLGESRGRGLSPAMARLWSPAAGAQWQLAIRLGAVTGARLGDAATMRAEAVSADGDLDYLPRKTRKSGAGRRVLFPVSALDADLGRDLVAAAAVAGGDGPLMPMLARVPVNTATGLSAQFRVVMEAAGIPLETVGKTTVRARWSHGFHSLRHAAITRAMKLGLPPEIRMALFGHSSIEVHGKYTHFDTAELRGQIERRMVE